MKVVAIVQARMGSTRLPNKVMKCIEGVPMIELLLMRLQKASELDEIVIATTIDKRDQIIINHLTPLGYKCYAGSENDVLDRYFQVSKQINADIVVRITGDCPLVDPTLVDELVHDFRLSNVDYLSNTLVPNYPDGLDIEVFSASSLEMAWKNATESYDREHVTPYIKFHDSFSKKNVGYKKDYSGLRWTVDEPEDFQLVKEVFEQFSPNRFFGWKDVLSFQNENPEIFSINHHFIRNEGAVMSTGVKLWRRAKNVIPGGNMLLSKRAEMFLPEKWPSYFDKAKGCKVWDLDGNEYFDMSIMGIGTNTLGYGNPEVDDAVRLVIDKGNMSTLNCPEEVLLAEKLIELHPWAHMVRFARSGGEANAIAIRIARAASGKDNVAICGYHGWHDWYLSANLGDDEKLSGHLLPGLNPKGVPRNLKGTVFPFTYNNYDELLELVDTHDIGVIKMEVMRNSEPENNFLHKVRKLSTERGIVLIFDECTSGFRETNGGLHKKYGVEPDMAMFGKALGNGYAITATIGRHAVMEAAQSTFISSTFWTERIGPSAAIKTLEVMERLSSWEKITNIGKHIRSSWQELADKHELKIEHWGIPALTGFTIKSPSSLAYKTFITQEMLDKGYLASNCVYACTEHTNDVINGYFEVLDPVFKVIRECEDGRDINSLLRSPICHSGFKRLN